MAQNAHDFQFITTVKNVFAAKNSPKCTCCQSALLGMMLLQTSSGQGGVHPPHSAPLDSLVLTRGNSTLCFGTNY